MLFVQTFVFGNFHTNAHILFREGADCVLFDTGCGNAQERAEMQCFIAEHNLTPRALMLTHGHFDHILDGKYFCDTFQIKSWAHPAECQSMADAVYIASAYGVQATNLLSAPDCLVQDHQELSFGTIRLQVLHVPGHTPGSVFYYEPEHRILFAGDTLTKGSLGFSESGYADLLQCLKQKIFPLPDDTRIFCGHGPPTTIGEEKSGNSLFKKCAFL